LISANLVLTLLKNMKGKAAFPEVQLFEAQPMSRAEVRRAVGALEVKGFVGRDGGEIKVSGLQKVQLAVLAVRLGASMDRVCRYLSWQEFEQITQLALGECGYETILHQRFRVGRRSCEIDVIGVLSRNIIAVDCKHWKHGLTRGAAEKIAGAQLQRAEALQLEENLGRIEGMLERSFKCVLMVTPVIVTLMENPTSIVRGVPVVPVLRLSSFLNELPGYLDVLATVTIRRGVGLSI